MPQPPPHDSDQYDGWTDTQLVTHVTSNAGAAGAGAAAELSRRLMIQQQRAADRSERLTTWVIWLTFAVVALTAVLVVDALV